MKYKTYIFAGIFACISAALFAFNSGWVLNMRGNVGGTHTLPVISDTDLKKLGAIRWKV